MQRSRDQRQRLASIAFGAVLTCALVSSAHAQRGGASISMQASEETVEIGVPFTLEVTVSSESDPISEIVIPPLDGFAVVSQQMSSPTRMTITNGRRTVQREVVYRFQLVAERPGRIELAPASARVGRGTIRSESLTLKVIGAGSSNTPGPAAVVPPGGDAAEFDDVAYLRTVIDNPSPWIGQQITVTLYLYTRLRNVQSLQSPTTDGFWVQDLLGTSPPPPTTQVVRGIPFNVHILKRFAAFPVRAGALTIGPASVTMIGGGSLFGPAQELRRNGVALTVNVRALPQNTPSDAFVGEYTAEAVLEPSTVRTGEAATITLTIRGTGSLRDARVAFPNMPGLRADAPGIDDRDLTTNDLVMSERRFRWLVVPERPGRFVIPDFALPVFDPARGVASALTTAPLTLEAVGGAVAQTPADEAEAEAEPDEAGPDAEHGLVVRATSELTRARPRLSDARFYPPAIALPPLLFLGVLISRATRDAFTRRRDAMRADRRREARRKLADARTHAKAGDATAFYAAVVRALTDAIEARLGAAVGALTHPELRAELMRRGMDEDLARRIVDELEGADFARFSATGTSADELLRALERADALLERIERFTPKEVPA